MDVEKRKEHNEIDEDEYYIHAMLGRKEIIQVCLIGIQNT